MIFLTVFSISCRNDNNDNNPSGGNYPKKVSTTYKVTSTTATSANLIQYKNETGANIDVPNPTLPFTKTFDRIVNKGDVLTVGYGTNTSQIVKIEILVNNVVVKSQEFSSTSGALVYLFE
ncbi:MAG: hypothetical protein BGO86_12220 [Chryseobacterium sp. 36-9]|nr:MAG: hypothetical protein BGO86_12220 [Chryseobacterium sp. 36-9]